MTCDAGKGDVGKLDENQRWLLGAITAREHPGEEQVEERLTAGPQQTAVERLGVYRHAYVARLLEVLRESLPCTRFAVGEEMFDTLMAGYLQAHPPASFTLARLADRLVEYLEATRPADWGEFVVELVRLEQAIEVVFDGPGGERLPTIDVADVTSGAMQVQLTPGCEVLEFRYPVSSYYTEWKAGHAPEWPEAEAQFVALVRREYVVRRYELDRRPFELLAALRRGAKLDDALAAVTWATDDLEEVAGRVQEWFAFWTKERFFVAAG